MYKISDKVIFNVNWMRAPVVGYIENIIGVQAYCRFAVPLMGHTHEKVLIKNLKPSEELLRQDQKNRFSVFVDIKDKSKKNKSIDQLVEDLTHAKKIRLQEKYRQ